MSGAIPPVAGHGPEQSRWLAVITRIVLLSLVGALLLDDASGAISAQNAEALEDIVVVLPDNVGVGEALRGRGIRASEVAITHRYQSVVNGFAAEVPASVRQELERIPGAIVSPNLPVESFAQKQVTKEGKRRKKRRRRRGGGSSTTGQVTPTGALRIAVDQNAQADIDKDGSAGIDVDVAILDTGIATHPDLTIAGGKDCSGEDTGNYADGDGHGTHVAGTAGAIDNTLGSVGVAPGARLYAVKVLDNNGEGSIADVICGLNWVIKNNEMVENQRIDVVNMSLGAKCETPCDDEALRLVVDNTLAAGVTVIVAAGNSADDAANYYPARYEEVITVSAFTDFNGRPGGGAPAACGSGDRDDTFANYSNYGEVVDIMAPGTCIRSTSPGNAYVRLTGTSMAAPHVSGAAALYIAVNQNATPADVQAYLTTAGSRPQRSPEGLVNDEDQDNDPEPVLYIPVGPPVPPVP